MPITTLDDLLASMKAPIPFWKVGTTMELAGLCQSYFYAAGNPGAAVASADGLAGAALTSYPGQIPFPANASGEDIHCARIDALHTSSIGMLQVLDRLWHNSGFVVTSTSAQTINSVTLPARDINGSTNGEGVYLAMEVTGSLGVGTPTITVSYTNSAGTSGRTATSAAISTTSQLGTWYPMPLQGADKGVRSIQSITSSATMTSGSVSFVLYREMLSIPMGTANFGVDRDAVALGFPRCFDESVPFLVGLAAATTATSLFGSLTWAQG